MKYDSSRGYLINFLHLIIIVSFISLAVFIIRQLIKFYILFPFLIYLKDALFQYSQGLYKIS